MRSHIWKYNALICCGACSASAVSYRCCTTHQVMQSATCHSVSDPSPPCLEAPPLHCSSTKNRAHNGQICVPHKSAPLVPCKAKRDAHVPLCGFLDHSPHEGQLGGPLAQSRKSSPEQKPEK